MKIIRYAWSLVKVTILWTFHVNAKFNHYKRMWEKHYANWQAARAGGAEERMLDEFEQQALYLRAEQLAHIDMRLPIRQRVARWDVDYAVEAQRALSVSPSREKRLDAIEKIVRENRVFHT